MATPRHVRGVFNVSAPFRLLQLVPETLPSFRADVATLFAKYLPRFGVECMLVGRGPNRHRQRWRNELAFAWHCIASAWRVPKKDVDLIQVRDMVSIGLVVLLVARLRGIPFAFWCSFLMSEGRIRRAREMLALRPSLHYRLVLWKGMAERALFYKLLLPSSDKVFVQSDAMREWMAARGIRRERLFAVPMGVDTELLDTSVTPRRLPGWEGLPVLAYLGTLDSSRDLAKLVDVLAILRERHPTMRLLLIGDSPTAGDVDRLCQYAGVCGVVDAVHVTGWLPKEEAWPLLAGADVAISWRWPCPASATTHRTRRQCSRTAGPGNSPPARRKPWLPVWKKSWPIRPPHGRAQPADRAISRRIAATAIWQKPCRHSTSGEISGRLPDAALSSKLA